MIHEVNAYCNVRTGEHVANHRRCLDITMPGLRVVLGIEEARAMRDQLQEAILFAEKLLRGDDRSAATEIPEAIP